MAAITALTLVSAMGRGLAATEAALRDGRGGLAPCDFAGLSLDTYIGRVSGIDVAPVVPELTAYDCRNGRLAQMALRTDGFEEAVRRAISRYGRDRIGVIIGTTSSGIQEAERAYAERGAETGPLPGTFQFEYSQSHYSATDCVRRYLGLQGPAFSVSTACSSSQQGVCRCPAVAWCRCVRRGGRRRGGQPLLDVIVRISFTPTTVYPAVSTS